MKNKWVKRTLALALATQVVATGVPVQAAAVDDVKEAKEQTIEDEEVAKGATDEEEKEEKSEEKSEEKTEEASKKEEKKDESKLDESKEVKEDTEESDEDLDEESEDEDSEKDEDKEDKDKKDKKKKKLKEEKDETPSPVYSYNFEDEDSVKGKLRDDAKIVKDEQKDSSVLYLPGKGSMDLPDDLFAKIAESENGEFTMSLWVNPASDAQNYSKFFDASNAPIGATNSGANWWNDPDFAFAAGGGAYDMTLYVGKPNESTDVKTKVKFDKQLTRDAWQYLTVTFKEDEYKVYLNGKSLGYTDGADNTKKVVDVLPKLLDSDYLKTLKYASLGKSYYTSDNDFKGYMDDVEFYDVALTEDQVKDLYSSFPEMKKPVSRGTLDIDMSAKTGPVKHGATGYLYGVGEDNVPSVNLQTAIKPYMCEQKPAEGLQHPNGDVLIMADTFLEAGGDSIQIACPDIYANWPYEYEGIDEYCEKLQTMVKQTKEAGLSDVAVYVLFNEPEGNWFNEIWSNDMSKFDAAWLKAYKAVKEIDKDAKVAGPNFCCYQARQLETYMQFCAENDCIPYQISWHVLNNDLYNNFHNNVVHYRDLEKKYWLEPGLITEPREIVINEYADFTHLGVPGALARWIGLFEDEKVTACLAYWHISNNLSDLAADNNEPNGAWWLYKWYGELSGETVNIDVSGLPQTQFYGVASVDSNKKSSNVIFGGAENAVLNLNNIDKSIFGDKIEVKFECTDWTGINGAAVAPTYMKKEVYEVGEDGSCQIKMDELVAAAAYNLTITPADDDAEVGLVENGPWKKTYEGEEAELTGGAREAGKNQSFACSGIGQAQGLDSENAKATFKVDVPEDGYYRFDMVYGAGTGNNTYNTAANDPKNAIQKLFVDGEYKTDMYLQNTLTFYMSGLHTEYVYLTKGAHDISVSGTDSEGKASIDCVYLTFVGDENALYNDKNVKTYEAELSDYNILGSQTATTVRTANDVNGYTGAGYAVGLDTSVKDGGGIRFITFAKENGTYKLSVKYNGSDAAEIGVYVNNSNKTLDRKVDTLKAAATGSEWNTVTTDVFLERGINIIDLDSTSAALAVDNLTIEKVDNKNITAIEAEDCKLIGDVTVAENPAASGGKFVNEILASKDGKNALEIEYNAPSAGKYELVVYQSNKELFGSHAYNAQMIDRFITLDVNGKDEKTVYFRNTYSVDSFRSQCVALNLKAGKNVIKIYNNDYRHHKNGVNGVNTCVNYTPNLDKFEFVQVSKTAEPEEPKPENPQPSKPSNPSQPSQPSNPSQPSGGNGGSSSSNGSSQASSGTKTIAEASVPAAGPAVSGSAPAQAGKNNAAASVAPKKSASTNAAGTKTTESAEEEADAEESEEVEVKADADVKEVDEKVDETSDDSVEIQEEETPTAVEEGSNSGLLAGIIIVAVLAVGAAVTALLRKGKLNIK